jgi:hypothetical protein
MNLIALSIIALAMGHVFSNAVRTLPAIAADVVQRGPARWQPVPDRAHGHGAQDAHV